MRAEGPIVWNRALGVFVVTHGDEIERVLLNRSQFQFSSRRDVQMYEHLTPEARAVVARGYSARSILVNDDPPTHRRLRALVRKGFSPRLIATLEALIHATAEALVEPMAASREMDVVDSLAVPLSLNIICSLFRVDPTRAARFKQSWTTLIQSRSLSAEEQLQHAEEVLAWQRSVGEVVEARRAAPQDDFVGRLVEAREDGLESLTTAEIVVFAMGLLFSGQETTAHLISNTVLQVVRHGIWARLENDRQLVPQAIEETLRFDPPVQGLFRIATEDTAVAGVKIPRGEQLFLSFASANRDPSRYAEPDRFNIDRDEPQRYLSFGHGSHFCLGADLAKLEARAALVALLSKVGRPRLADGEIEYDPSLVLRGPASLKLIPWRG